MTVTGIPPAMSLQLEQMGGVFRAVSAIHGPNRRNPPVATPTEVYGGAGLRSLDVKQWPG